MNLHYPADRVLMPPDVARPPALRGLKLHAVLTASLTLTSLIGNPNLTLIVGGILYSVGLVVVARWESKKSPLRLTPISFYLLYCSFNLGAAAAYVGYTTMDGLGLSLANSIIPPEHLAIAYVIYAWGVFAFHVGLEWL